MRAIPSTMDPKIVAAVDDRVRVVADTEQVVIPWAIESGSRAWGFPSPDSDYDCRFFYVRRRNDYLSPWPRRDVIETPLDKVFDVNGWDVIKAVRLLVKGNATVTEWLRSPIIYSGDESFRDGMLELAASLYDPVKAARHYRHVGLQQKGTATETLALKRVFYALRPAATLYWLRLNPNGGVPPMDLPSLIEQADPGPELRSRIADLIALKSTTRELGNGEVPTVILDFIERELDLAEPFDNMDPTLNPDRIALAEEWFRNTLDTWGDDTRSGGNAG